MPDKDFTSNSLAARAKRLRLRWRQGQLAAPLVIAGLALAPMLSSAAGSSLDELLARSLGSPGGPSSPGNSQVHESAAGSWTLSQNPKTPGLSCAILFNARANPGSVLGFLGPSGDSPVGVILFAGPQIPKTTAVRQVTVRLDTTGDPSQTVRATHLPRSPEVGVLAVTTEMKSTVSAIDDVETVTLQLDGSTVFRLDYQGGHAARDALLKCMAARKAER